jgi:hypothetical protein
MDSEQELESYLSERLFNSEEFPLLLEDSVEKIWSYDNGWFCYEPGVSEQCVLNSLKPNHGYWLLLKRDAVLHYGRNDFSPIPLEILNPRWALIGQSLTRSTTISSNILSLESIESGHSARTVKRIWGYENGWKSHSVEGTWESPVHSGFDLMEPGLGYWFLLEPDSNQIVSAANPLVLRPAGFYPEPAVVIGGASTLRPPEKEANISPIRFSVNGNNLLESDGYCDGANLDRPVGYVSVWSIEGVRLNNHIPAPIFCSEQISEPLTWEVAFSQEEKDRFEKDPTILKNLTIKLELFTGQEEKAFFGSEIHDSVMVGEHMTSADGFAVNTSSTLAAVLLGMELSIRLGMASDQWELGKTHSEVDPVQIHSILKSPEQPLEPGAVVSFLQDATASSGSLLKEYSNLLSTLNSKECASVLSDSRSRLLLKILSGGEPSHCGVQITQGPYYQVVSAVTSARRPTPCPVG